MIGLMVASIFAATTSSMEPGLNKNAGIFVMNFYKPILRKHATDREYLVAGKIASLVFGLLVIGAALVIEGIKGVWPVRPDDAVQLDGGHPVPDPADLGGHHQDARPAGRPGARCLSDWLCRCSPPSTWTRIWSDG